MKRLSVFVLAIASLAGCGGTAFTSIQKLPDNSYYLTENFLYGRGASSGSTWRCLPEQTADVMACKRVGTP